MSKSQGKAWHERMAKEWRNNDFDIQRMKKRIEKSLLLSCHKKYIHTFTFLFLAPFLFSFTQSVSSFAVSLSLSLSLAIWLFPSFILSLYLIHIHPPLLFIPFSSSPCEDEKSWWRWSGSLVKHRRARELYDRDSYAHKKQFSSLFFLWINWRKKRQKNQRSKKNLCLLFHFLLSLSLTHSLFTLFLLSILSFHLLWLNSHSLLSLFFPCVSLVWFFLPFFLPHPLTLPDWILDNLVKKLNELEATEFMYQGICEHIRQMAKAFVDLCHIYKGNLLRNFVFIFTHISSYSFFFSFIQLNSFVQWNVKPCIHLWNVHINYLLYI